eukprot:TRINITY_DN10780_c0_g1_i1.p2 TRINITY_DN10780_c0_g1~~TRINITY_DN10780_c0_g1_i1.p2  ORF type:complete len:601 (-),score=135.01 TRINITY_DN10780_c0_g1_i1:21-1823(-)
MQKSSEAPLANDSDDHHIDMTVPVSLPAFGVVLPPSETVTSPYAYRVTPPSPIPGDVPAPVRISNMLAPPALAVPFNRYLTVPVDTRLPIANRHGGMPATHELDLCKAVENCNVSEMQRLLKLGTKVNCSDFEGRSPLHLALDTGRIDIVEELLGHSANPNAKEEYGNTPLLIACDRGDLDLVRSLIKHGADVNGLGLFGRTALSAAAMIGCIDLMQVLIELGVPVDIADTDKNTPLHHACYRNHDAAAMLLLDAGADTTKRNIDEQTPEDQMSPALKAVLALRRASDAESQEKYRQARQELFKDARTTATLQQHTKDALSVENMQRLIPNFNSIRQIEPGKLRKAGILGEGYFSVVHDGICDDSTPVAVKVLKQQHACDRAAEMFALEVGILSRLHHPLITELVGVTLHPQLCIVTRKAAGGTLQRALREGLVRDEHRLQYARDVAMAVQHLHAQRPMVLMRDLNSANVLLHEGRALLIDFGLSAYLEPGKSLSSCPAVAMRWMAPEVFRVQRYTQAADIYSLGIILCELVTDSLPFADLSAAEAVRRAAEGLRPELPADVTGEYRELVQQCLQDDAAMRPSADDVVKRLEAMLARHSE